MLSLIEYIQNPSLLFASLVQHLNFLFPDKLYLQILYRLKQGTHLDLKCPKSFTEKLQWLKLYNRKSEYSAMVDKILAKEYVFKLIGDEYIIPTLGVWDKPEQIDWDNLPEKFVLKTNHSGGNTGVVLCKDKSKLDKKEVIVKMNLSLKTDNYKKLREWPYRGVEKKVFAEAYMENEGESELTDYKFYCFGGEPKYIQVIQGRRAKETIDFFDIHWNHQKFVGLNPKAENAIVEPIRPKNLELMLDIARKLSADIPFVRVDLYEINNTVYFGEITFFPASGFGFFRPNEANEMLGELIVISK